MAHPVMSHVPLNRYEVDVTGVELTPQSSGNLGDEVQSGAKSGALDPSLAIVVSAWPALSEGGRKAILTIIRQAAKG
jgi:hypothetical protein